MVNRFLGIALVGIAVAACLLPAPAVEAGLIARYDFENTGTPGLDSAGGHNGTVSGSAALTTQSRIGLRAMSFTGGDISIPFSSDFALNTFSVSAWVRIAAEQVNGGILGTRFGGEPAFDVKVRATDIHGDVSNGSAWIDTAVDIRNTDTGTNGQGGDIPLNSWQLITYVIDDVANEFRLFIGDDLKRTIAYSGTPLLMKAGETMHLANACCGELLNGRLDDVRIYNHALSQGEIHQLAIDVGPQPVPGLFNSGVNVSGLALVGGDPSAPVNDPHYNVIQFAGSPVSPFAAFAAEADGFPIGPWLANDADSRWIDPNGAEDSNAPLGDYIYRTTFTLPSNADLANVMITGGWATDNGGLDILINGISTGQTSGGFGSLTSFTINSGFVGGLNTLDFVVNNLPASNNPTGLRVDNLEGRFVTTPEPTTLALLGLGLLGIARRRRSR